jgi:hypothetical protein
MTRLRCGQSSRRCRNFSTISSAGDGQDCVQREGRYLPLTAAIVREQLKKLE